MATVEFESATEFLAELKKDRRHVDRKIVRLVELRRGSAMSSAVAMTVVGTARVGSDIYRVECFFGALCGIEESDRRVLLQLRKQINKLRIGCTILGLNVRSGLLEPDSY